MLPLDFSEYRSCLIYCLVIGNEITADSQAHVHRLLCSESRLFASRPPSPVASVVNSVIKAQQTEPETPAENRLNEYGVKKTSESNVVNSYRDNQGDDNYVQFELKQQLETPRPRKTLEMFIPQVRAGKFTLTTDTKRENFCRV